MTRRVVQWATGNVGSESLRAIVGDPTLELVGVYTHAPERAGKDAGELVGMGPVGVQTSNDAEAMLALRPDCISYAAVEPDVDLLSRMLDQGTNVVTTSMFLTGFRMGEADKARLEAAAERGGASIFGSGIQPGLADYLALVTAGVCSEIRQIRISETVDSTGYAAADVWRSCGFGYPIGTPGLKDMVRTFSAVFGDAVEMMAEALEVALDDIDFDVEFAEATDDIVLPYMTIEKGHVAGLRYRWLGMVGERPVICLEGIWRIGYTMEPDWPVREGWYVDIDGVPKVSSQITVAPPDDWSEEEWPRMFGMITALPIVNAIDAVCNARAGIVSYKDLPLITSANRVR